MIFDEGVMTRENLTERTHEFNKDRPEIHDEKNGCPFVVSDKVLQKIKNIHKDWHLITDKLVNCVL